MFFALVKCVYLVELFGVNSTVEQRYRAAIDIQKQTFTCFDGSQTISLSHFNDDYRDCPDGSDEPSSSDGSGLFVCKNEGYISYAIPRWSVGDGICDCCDGSDESFNPHANCSNTCDEIENERQRVLTHVRSVYEKGLKMKAKMITKGYAMRDNATVRVQEIDNLVTVCNRKLKILKDVQVIKDEPDDDDTDVNIDWTAPIAADFNEGSHIVESWREVDANGTDLVEPMPEQDKNTMLKQLRNEKKTLKKELKRLNYTDVPDEFVLIHGRKFSMGEYRTRFFESFHQGSTSLGNFKEYKDRTVEYDRGTYCWQTQSGRKTHMKLVCMKANKLLSVTEPSVCDYVAVFGTPAVCSQDDLDSLTNMTLPQLHNINLT